MSEFLRISDLVEAYSTAEAWRPISGFEEYEVSSFGRIRRVSSWRILKPAEDKGYLFVTLCKDNKKTNGRIHQIVAQEFYGPPPA